MGKPHKHAAVIKAWADGVEIQFKHPNSKYWKNLVQWENPQWFENLDYRIKPKPCVIKYRVALFHEDEFFWTELTETGHASFWDRKAFIRWLTDWIEVEV